MDETITTKSAILIDVNNWDEITKLLRDAMTQKNFGVREIARYIGVSHPIISDIVTNGAQPSFETCDTGHDTSLPGSGAIR